MASSKPRGAPTLYKHRDQKPECPPGGWQPCRLSSNNPAFVYLKAQLDAGTISHTTPPHLVYNAHPALYNISPYKFAKFFKLVVKKVLGIVIDITRPKKSDKAAAAAAEEEEEDSTAAADDTSTADDNEEEEEEEDATAADNEEEDDGDEADNTVDPTTSSNLDSTTASASYQAANMSDKRSAQRPEVDEKGTVIHAAPLIPSHLNNGPQTAVCLEHWDTPWVDGRGTTLYVIPQVGMTQYNTGMRRSSRCDHTMVMNHHKGVRADANKLEKAFTKGKHHIRYGKKDKRKKLKLPKTDVNVVNLTAHTQNANGEAVRGLTTSSVYQAFKFEKAVKNKLKNIMASNNTELPGKYCVAPDDERDENGVHVLVFNIEWESSDTGAMNM